MNRIASTVSIAIALGVLTTLPAGAETVSTTKTTTYSGMVSDVNPTSSTIVFKTESSSAPVTYTYSKETTFVDSKGNVITSETIRNSPVTVEYAIVDGQTVVRKVIQTAPGVAVVVPATPGMAPGAAVVPANPAVIEKTTTRTETH